MSARIVLAAACVCATAAGSALAQEPFHYQEATDAFHYREATEAFHAAIAQATPQLLPPAPIQPNAPTPRTPTPPRPPALPVPKVSGQSVNVKVEFVITDQRDGSAAMKKTVSATVADGNLGSIRSEANAGGFVGAVPLNIDATPTLLADGKIRLQFTVQYDMSTAADPKNFSPGDPRANGVTKTSLRNSMTVILESGKAMLAAQSADPIGDRRVTVEVTATILK